MELSNKKGFTIIELLVSLAIISLLAVIVFSVFTSFRKNQALIMDTDLLVEVLRQARNQTLSSKDSSVYGVHFTSTKITLFKGSVYTENSANNQDFILSSSNANLTLNLASGGSDVVFNRLTGETINFGTIVVVSSNISKSKTVTIYKTGLVESD